MIIYRELSSLERDLQFPAKVLYSISNNLSKHYSEVLIPKKSGGYRKLMVPDKILKCVQKRIAQMLLPLIPVSPYAAAYIPGGSTKRNAKPHVGKQRILKLDIYNFFDSVRYSDVKEKVFPASIYSDENRILLSHLCYFHDSLPQGAPSSPMISNILLYDFDIETSRWCSEKNIVYTRYCDDMTFSGDFSASEIIEYAAESLKKHHFLLNRKKIVAATRSQRQIVTGLITNSRLNVPAPYRKQIRQEMYYCQKYGIKSHIERCGLDCSEQNYRNHMLGKINYVLSVSENDDKMLSYKRWLLK